MERLLIVLVAVCICLSQSSCSARQAQVRDIPQLDAGAPEYERSVNASLAEQAHPVPGYPSQYRAGTGSPED